MRTRGLSGLGETWRRWAALNVIIVDEEFARRHWPNGDAVGKRVRFSNPLIPAMTVVGVVARVKQARLNEQGGFVQAYLPLLQFPDPHAVVVIKTTLKPETMVTNGRLPKSSIQSNNLS